MLKTRNGPTERGWAAESGVKGSIGGGSSKATQAARVNAFYASAVFTKANEAFFLLYIIPQLSPRTPLRLFFIYVHASFFLFFCFCHFLCSFFRRLFNVGLFLHPLTLSGQYPKTNACPFFCSVQPLDVRPFTQEKQPKRIGPFDISPSLILGYTCNLKHRQHNHYAVFGFHM